MAKRIGDIVILDEADLKEGSDPGIKALEGIEFGKPKMPFGFTLKMENGRRFVEPMEKSEWLLLMKRVNPDFDHDKAAGGCYAIDERTCSYYYCGNGSSCRRMYDTRTGKYWCGCS